MIGAWSAHAIVLLFALFLSVAFADDLLLLVCVVRAWSALVLACLAPEGARELLFFLVWLNFAPEGLFCTAHCTRMILIMSCIQFLNRIYTYIWTSIILHPENDHIYILIYRRD